MNSGYFPVVVAPGVRPQTADQQAPFFFGGSQVPSSLMGIGGGAIYNPTGDPAITKKNEEIGRRMRGGFKMMKGKGHFHKGMMSITHPGDMDFTTKRGDLVYHRDGHNVKLFGRPYKSLRAIRTFSK